MEAVSTTPVAATGKLPGPDGPSVAFRETRTGWAIFAFVWLASAVYLGVRLKLAWAPLDAGPLAQMADRVLRGQVPFRDFIELYTGGLDYLNALAFRLFGVNFLSLRLMMFPFFLGWVPSVYFIARRFARPLGAGAITLLAVAWGPAVYPEAMACWYNLFFATWGVLALLRYTENEKKRWLWVAGLCAGLSFLVKIIGLYFVAAALLFFVFREQAVSRSTGTGSRLRGLSYRLFITAGLFGFLAYLTNLISWTPGVASYVQFVLPSLCLVAAILWPLWRDASGPAGPRFRRLFGMGLPFAAGILAPVLVFLLWLLKQRALAPWARGTFVTPTARFHWVGGPPAPLGIVAGLLPLVLVVLLAYDPRKSSRCLVNIAGPIGLAILLAASWKSSPVYLLVGFSLPLLVPALALLVPFALRKLSGRRRQRAFLLASAAVLCALVQFPSPASIYFNYAAPLVILGLLALASTRPDCNRFAVGSLLAFYLVFALWLGAPGYWSEVRLPPGDRTPLAPLTLSRAGGILMKPSEAHEYEALVPLIREHADGPYIYCAPDCPEVYFLSGKFNPTPSLNDFLDPDFADVLDRTHRILSTLQVHGVNVVVFQSPDKGVSGHLPASLRVALDARFPDSERVGNFEVRWKP